MNPDNYRYYEGLQRCLGLLSERHYYSSDEIDRLDALYKSLGQQYIRSSAVKRIPLDFLKGEKFWEAADNYIRPLLRKGVPSLFSDLSPLYDHPGKADILEQLILELEHSIRTTGGYPGRTEEEPPSTLLWALFYLAQVKKRVETAESKWKGWNWRSEGDMLLNGAYFTASGAGASASYARASSLGAKSSSMVGSITSGASALGCRRGLQC